MYDDAEHACRMNKHDHIKLNIIHMQISQQKYWYCTNH